MIHLGIASEDSGGLRNRESTSRLIRLLSICQSTGLHSSGDRWRKRIPAKVPPEVIRKDFIGNVKLRNAGYRLVAPQTPNAQAVRPATPPMVPPLTVSLSVEVSVPLSRSDSYCGGYRYSCDVLVMLLLFFWREDLHLV